MRPSSRLELIPPYLFAELERKVAAKRAAGIDVISLGIGDPDMPTYAPIVAAAQRAVADPSTHTLPVEPRPPRVPRGGRRVLRSGASASTLDPDTEVMPAIGAKECIFNLNLAFLDPGDVALAADPGYPVYTGGPLLAGGEPVLMPLAARARVRARPRRDRRRPTLERARLMFLNYPNNPTGAVVPDGLFERGDRARAARRLPGRPRQRLQRDDLRRLRRAVVPRDPRCEGGRRRGVLALEGLQHDRLAVRGDRRQRRRDRRTTGG